MGALAETAVVAQWFHDPGPIHYARWDEDEDEDEAEVDLVRLDSDGRPTGAAEIKWSDRYVAAPDQLKGLIRFAKGNGLAGVTATTRSQIAERAAGGVNIRMIPTSVYAWSVGEAILSGGPG